MTQTLTRGAKGRFVSPADSAGMKAVRAQIAHEEAHRFHGDQIGTDAGYDDMRPLPRVLRHQPMHYQDDYVADHTGAQGWLYLAALLLIIGGIVGAIFIH